MSETQHYRINLNEAIWQYQNKLISGTTLVYYYFRIRFAPGCNPSSARRNVVLSKLIGHKQ